MSELTPGTCASELNFTGEIRMNKNPLTQALFELKDEKYRLFQAKKVVVHFFYENI